MNLKNHERILVVEGNAEICDLLVRQLLKPVGYQVQLASDVASGIRSASRQTPDLVLVDLDLPGLSGKDLLVALNSQGIKVPVIVIAKRGQENSIIQAFRLGASDYLFWPARDTEVISTVERALERVREEKTRRLVDAQLKSANLEVDQRRQELELLRSLGREAVQTRDEDEILAKILDGCMAACRADYGWLMLRQADKPDYILKAHRNLPEAWASKAGRKLDDGVSPLVALSGEALSIHGEPLKRFNLFSLGRSVLCLPVKERQEVVGQLVLVRRADSAFEPHLKEIMEVITSILSLVIFNPHGGDENAKNLPGKTPGDSGAEGAGPALKDKLQKLLQPAVYPIDMLLTGSQGKLTAEQQEAMKVVQRALKDTLAEMT